MAVKRLQKELQELENDLPPYTSAGPTGDDIFDWHAQILGPEDTPYEGGLFLLNLKFRPDHPHKPPLVTFRTKVFHSCVDQSGFIGLDIFRHMWSPRITVKYILTVIVPSLFMQPQPDGIQHYNSEAAELYRRDPNRYYQVARQWAQKYADVQTHSLIVTNMFTSEIVLKKEVFPGLRVGEVKSSLSKILLSKKGYDRESVAIDLFVPRSTKALLDHHNLPASDMPWVQMLLGRTEVPKSLQAEGSSKRARTATPCQSAENALGTDLKHYLLACARRQEGPAPPVPVGYERGYGCLGFTEPHNPVSTIYMMLPPIQVESHVSENTIVLFQYGSLEAYKGIAAYTGLTHLRASRDDRAHFGDGPYATQKAPHDFGSKEAVLLNNYTNKSDITAQHKDILKWKRLGNADYCFPVLVNSSQAINVKLQKTKEMPKVGHTKKGEPIRDDRDIWVILIPDACTGEAQDAHQNIAQLYNILKSNDGDVFIRRHAVQALATVVAETSNEEATRTLAALAASGSKKDQEVRTDAIWGVAYSQAWTTEQKLKAIGSLDHFQLDPRVKEAVPEALRLLGVR